MHNYSLKRYLNKLSFWNLFPSRFNHFVSISKFIAVILLFLDIVAHLKLRDEKLKYEE